MNSVITKIYFALKLVVIYFAVALVIGLAVWTIPFSPRGSLHFRNFSDSAAIPAMFIATIAFLVGLSSAVIFYFMQRSKHPGQPVTLDSLFNQQDLAMKKAAAFGKRYYFQIMVAVIVFAILVAVVDALAS